MWIRGRITTGGIPFCDACCNEDGREAVASRRGLWSRLFAWLFLAVTDDGLRRLRNVLGHAGGRG